MNIKKPLLRWSVAVLAVLMLTACGSPTSTPTTSPATRENTVQKAQTGQVTFNVQFPQAALKKALIDDRTVSIYVGWYAWSTPAQSWIILTPDPLTGLATGTLDVPVGNTEFTAYAIDNNGVELDFIHSAGEITPGNNTVYLTFLSGDWQLVDAYDNPLPQSFDAITLSGFSLTTVQTYGAAAKATVDYTKPLDYNWYQLQWHNNTSAIGPLVGVNYVAQFGAPAATGSSVYSRWLNITDPTRSDSLYNPMGTGNYQAGDRIVSIFDWEASNPETITDANNVNLIPQFQTFSDSQILDGKHISGHLMAMTFDGQSQSGPTGTIVDCATIWYSQPITPAAARTAAIKASLSKAASKAAIGDETTLAAGTATVKNIVCDQNVYAAKIDGDGDGDYRWEELTYDDNYNSRYDAGDIFIDSDFDGHWDYTYYPGTTYDITEQYSNIVVREFRAKGSQLGSVFTPPAPVAPTAFSAEWLNGKTLYQVWFGTGEDSLGNTLSDVPVVAEVTFSNGTITNNGLLNSFTGSTTYAVDAFGMLYTNGDMTSGNTIVSGSTDQYIKTHYTVNGVIDNVDLYFFNESEAMAFAGTLTASIPPTEITTPTAAAMIGTWIRPANVDGNAVIMTILDEATYTLIEDDPSGISTDFEYGNFTFDSMTGTFTPYLLVDTNPSSGPSGAGGPLNITSSGNTMTLVGGPTFTKLAADPTKPIVGSWAVQEPNPTVVTFLADGTYYISQNAEIATGVTAGLERGTYSYSGTTLTATGIIRTLSGGGLAAPEMTTTINFTISGDNATFSDLDYSVPLKRVIAPATPEPLLGTWYNGSTSGDFSVITMLDTNTYVGATGTIETGASGIEYGPYSFTANQIVATPSLKTSAVGWGLSYMTQLFPYTYSMFIVEPSGSGFFRKLIKNVDYPLIGTWGSIDTITQDGVVMTFLDDGSYMMVQTSPADGVGQPGNEWGTYNWNMSTGILFASVVGDTNGEWGLSHPQGTLQFTVTINTITNKDELIIQELDGSGTPLYTMTIPKIY